jgi:Flp pilus assembly protein TadD
VRRRLLMLCLVPLLLAGPIGARQRGEGEAPAAPVFVPDGLVRSPFVEVRGQVFVNRARQLTDPIEIRLTEQSGIVRDYGGAFGSGHFVFRDVPSTGVFYIDIEVEGFEPIHYRLDGAELAVGPFLTFILRSTEPIVEIERDETGEGGGLEIVDLTELQTEIPDEARDAYEDAMNAAGEGDHSRAVEGLLSALEHQPAYFEARNNLGVQYLMLGRVVEAEAAFRHARELSPNSAKPLLNLGTLYIQVGDRLSQSGDVDAALARYREAVAVLDEAIIKDPLTPETSYYSGVALYKTGEYDASEAVLYRALDLDPQYHQARLVLVNVYTRLGLLSDALAQADRFIELNPTSPQRAALEEIVGQIEAAIDR